MSLVEIAICVAALASVSGFLLRCKPLGIKEAADRIREEGIFYWQDRPDLAEDFPTEAKPLTAQLFNKGLSLIYFRTYQGQTPIESMDLLFPNRPITQTRKLCLYFYNGHPTAKSIGFGGKVSLTTSELDDAHRILRVVRANLPTDTDFITEFPLV